MYRPICFGNKSNLNLNLNYTTTLPHARLRLITLSNNREVIPLHAR